MRAARIAFLMVVAAVICAGFGTTSLLAFHDGGVAECSGCHTMHGAQSSSLLLAGTDRSSTCLNCHERAGYTGPSSYHMSTPGAELGAGNAPKQRTPGGDFGWLKKTFTWTSRGSLRVEAGQTHGHNIVALDYGYSADTNNTTAPGGTFAANKLGCTSCHDPHGQYRRTGPDAAPVFQGGPVPVDKPIIDSGSYDDSPDPGTTTAVGAYRLLAGSGYDYDPTTAVAAFAANPPHAIAPHSYNKREDVQQVKVAYGQGMGQWCATCHPNMISGNHHPVSTVMGSGLNVLNNYVTYRGTATYDTTDPNDDAYLSLVPYEENSNNYTLLKSKAGSDDLDYEGPDAVGASGAVTCLSCHRAHASGWVHAMRWNPESEFLLDVDDWPSGSSAQGHTYDETKAAYYDRDPAVAFGGATYQRSLCNKCHAND